MGQWKVGVGVSWALEVVLLMGQWRWVGGCDYYRADLSCVWGHCRVIPAGSALPGQALMPSRTATADLNARVGIGWAPLGWQF